MTRQISTCRSSAVSRLSGRPLPSTRTTRSRVASWPNEPPERAISTRGLADEQQVKVDRRDAAVAEPVRAVDQQHHAPARGVVDEQGEDPPRPGRGLEGQLGRGHAVRVAGLVDADGPATCYVGETNRIRSRNCPCLRCGTSGAATCAGPIRTCTARQAAERGRGGRMFANSDELLKYIKDEGVEMVDVRFCDLPGIMQHFTVPVSSFDQAVFDDGLDFDGSSIRGFQAIHESDMALFPDPTTAYLDPFRTRQDAGRQLLHPRPAHRRGLLAATRATSPARPRPTSPRTGIGDTAYFAPEAEFYVFDNVRFETKAERRLLPDRLRGRRLEHRLARTNNRGYKVALQGRLLPGRAVRPLRRPARRDGHRAGEVRPRTSSAPTTRSAPPARPRSTTVRRAAQGRRRRDEVQVHRQERRLAQRQDRDLHAEADLRRQRLGHARATSRIWNERRAAVLRRDRATPACPTSPATTSAASSSTPRRCWRSPTRR